MLTKNITNLTVGPIATNCWIYPFGEKDAAIIDPGDEADVIIPALKKLNLVPKFILLTHGHFDHIAAVPELLKAFSTPPLIGIHRLDSEYLGAGAYKAHSLSFEAAMGDRSMLEVFWPDCKQGLPPPDHQLEEGSSIGPFTVLHLPGHTPGCIAFWDKDEGILFTGDTLFKGNYGRTDLPGGNEQEIMISLRRLMSMDENIKVYPGHGPVTTIGEERGII